MHEIVQTMNGQMPSFKKYKMSLDNMAEPIMPSQLPKVKMDLAGLSRYAKKKEHPCTTYQVNYPPLKHPSGF